MIFYHLYRKRSREKSRSNDQQIFLIINNIWPIRRERERARETVGERVRKEKRRGERNGREKRIYPMRGYRGGFDFLGRACEYIKTKLPLLYNQNLIFIYFFKCKLYTK